MDWPKMPLLTTLAVLVILVHSEEIEKENYRVSPRLADLRDTDYDQSWRAVESQLTTRLPPQRYNWEGTLSEELSKRRRPGRKRYRRPRVPSDEDKPMPRRPYFDDSPDPYGERETQSYETTNPPKRRFKKPNNRNNYYSSDHEVQRPLRRGQRRRRPTPRTTDAILLEHTVQQSGQIHDEIYAKNIEYDRKELKHPQEKEEKEKQNDEMDEWFEREIDKAFGDFGKEFDHSPVVEEPQQIESNVEFIELRIKQGSDVSNSSTEKEKGSHYHYNQKLKQQGEDKSLQSESPQKQEIKEEISFNISPLKELLKRSNGSSLSESLQRKNLSLADLLSGSKNAIQALQMETLIHSDETKRTNETNDSAVNRVVIEKISGNSKTKSHEFFANNELMGTEPIQKTHIRSTSSLPDHLSKQDNKIRYNNTYDDEKNENKNSSNVTVNFDFVRAENTSTITSRKLLPSDIRKRPKIRFPIRNNTTTKIYMKQVQSTPATQMKSTRTMIPIKETENIIEIDTNDSKDEISTTNSYLENDDELTTTETSTLETTLDYTNTQSHFRTSNQISITTTQTGKKTNITPIEIHSTTEMAKNNIVSHKPITEIRPRLIVTNSELRKQILNNRLKRKRLRQKESTDGHKEETMKNTNVVNDFGLPSEFITRTEQPFTHLTTKIKPYIEATEMSEDLMTTHEMNTKADENLIPKHTTIKSHTITLEEQQRTEDMAKKEIDEILEDLDTRKRLSKILTERNMTFKELAAHRERGSSQVHLADIFHNASRNPSPPKSFLSKSSIEPISKEIYPLRVLLEANLHETTTQTATLKTYHDQLPNIPFVMNFGNNVNENGEKLGMGSITNKFHNHSPIDKHGIRQDSEGGTYFTSVMSVNISHDAREGRRLNANSALDNLKKIISTMQKEFMNKTRDLKETPGHTHKNAPFEQDQDGDGLIILEDLQQLDEADKDLNHRDENFDTKRHSENSESTSQLPNKSSSKAKSVTVVTSAVVALMMILFLLAYIGCKWQQKRNLRQKDSFKHGKINTPVFENRKSAKNSSTRSISPMLSTSNIYNMSTIDTRNSKESSEYMWDSLRKPFQ